MRRVDWKASSDGRLGLSSFSEKASCEMMRLCQVKMSEQSQVSADVGNGRSRLSSANVPP